VWRPDQKAFVAAPTPVLNALSAVSRLTRALHKVAGAAGEAFNTSAMSTTALKLSKPRIAASTSSLDIAYTPAYQDVGSGDDVSLDVEMVLEIRKHAGVVGTTFGGRGLAYNGLGRRRSLGSARCRGRWWYGRRWWYRRCRGYRRRWWHRVWPLVAPQ